MIGRASALLLLGLAACTSGAGNDEGADERGVAALERGQPKIARIEFLKGIEAEPNSSKIRLLQAQAYLALNDGLAAQAEITRARQLGASAAATAHLMAHALVLQGRNDEALVQAAAAAPSHAAYAQRIGRLARMALDNRRAVAALLGRGQGEEALQLARQTQAEHPGMPDAHMLVGDALGTRGDFKGAAREYRKAANLAFTEPVAMRMIEALQRSGKSKAAAQVLQLFRERNPESVPASMLAASGYMQARDWPSAIRTYEALRSRIGDRDAVMLNNLAWAYLERGDYARAIPLARKAWSLDKSNPATADTLGWLLFKSGEDKKQGLALLQRAARSAPNDAQIQQHLQSARNSS